MEARLAYKVLTRAEWDSWRRDGVFLGSAADLADGFIHLSLAEQLGATPETSFIGGSNTGSSNSGK